jgi:hypothetical protein
MNLPQRTLYVTSVYRALKRIERVMRLFIFRVLLIVIVAASGQPAWREETQNVLHRSDFSSGLSGFRELFRYHGRCELSIAGDAAYATGERRKSHKMRFFAPFLLIASTLAASAETQKIYVAPDGNDGATGTAEKPFRTLRRARDVVREANTDMSADIVVNLHAGNYYLDEPLILTGADSGSNGFDVVYRSADGPGKARVSGSRLVTGWELHEGGIWKISVGDDVRCHTLYENGQRARKSRFPNYEHDPRYPCAAGRYLVSMSGSPQAKEGVWESWLTTNPYGLPPENADFSQLKINVFPWGKCDWHRWICEVTKVDRETRTVVFDNQGDRTEINDRARYFFEDALALLDAPGEFFLDGNSNVLYYYPRGSDHPDELGITMPVTHDLIRIEGEDAEHPAHHIRFEGLVLEETDAISPTRFWWQFDWGKKDHALIWMSNTNHIVIRNCHLRNSGRHGVMMIGENRRNTVSGCWIEQMGVNGITLCNRFGNPAGKGATKDRLEHNVLTNNRIHDVGQLSIYNACVNLMNGSHNEVSHSEFSNSPRYAVTMRGNTNSQLGEPGWNQRFPPACDNVFKYLRIRDCGQDSGDMGALHAACLNIAEGPYVNRFEQIVIGNTRAAPGMQDWPPDGIFLDWKSRTMHQVFRHIRITGSQGMPLRSNGPDNERSAVFENVSWRPGFDGSLIEEDKIGMHAEFPLFRE